jgi:inhibitor of cysteine peptidase
MTSVVLTERDNGGSFEVKRGEEVTVRLDETASSGYRWAVDSRNDPVLHFQSDGVVSSSPAIGSKSAVEFDFQAAQAGSTEIRLKLWRDWEGDTSIADRFAATVRVR